MKKADVDTDLSKLLTIARRLGKNGIWTNKPEVALSTINAWPWYNEDSKILAEALVTGEPESLKPELDELRDMAGVL